MPVQAVLKELLVDSDGSKKNAIDSVYTDRIGRVFFCDFPAGFPPDIFNI